MLFWGFLIITIIILSQNPILTIKALTLEPKIPPKQHGNTALNPQTQDAPTKTQLFKQKDTAIPLHTNPLYQTLISRLKV